MFTLGLILPFQFGEFESSLNLSRFGCKFKQVMSERKGLLPYESTNIEYSIIP